MKVRFVASTCGEVSELQYASSFILNNFVAIDAGSLGMAGTPLQQAAIRHVFLTHSHIDHIATLPTFLENAFDPEREAVAVYAAPTVLKSLQSHIFNGVIWPDFVRLTIRGHPLVRLVALEEETPIDVGTLTVTPVGVRHVVPTFGYIVTDGDSTVVFGADSGPTDRIWRLARKAPRPLSIFLEACFPNELKELACISGHLTPALVAEEIRKLPEADAVVATHLKAKYRDQIVQELTALDIPHLVIGRPGHEYQFGNLAESK